MTVARLARAAFALLATIAGGPLGAQAAGSAGDVAAYLRERVGFPDAEIERVRRGDVVTRRLRPASRREVALVGVVSVRGEPAALIDAFRAREPLLRSRQATLFGLFSRPPSEGDLRRLVLPPDDVAALRSCTQSACTLKMPAELIGRIRALDWSAPQVGARVNEVVRAWLADYVGWYVSRGNSGLVVYGDKDRPLPLHEGLRALLAESPYLVEYVPEFHHYVEDFPARNLAGVDEVLYWSLEEFGLRPLTTVTHAVSYVPPAARGLRAIVALKRIYASHYFQAGLTLLMAVDDTGDPARPRFSLVYLDRQLFDTDLSGLKRRSVEGRLEDDLRQRLGALQRALEDATRR